MSVRLVTDSTSYIHKNLIKELEISVASLNVVLNGKSYREVELDNKTFYEEMDKSGEIPTSSQPSMDELLNIFKDLASKGHDIVGIFISSKMSGTFSTAHLIKEMVLEEYPNTKIEIVDSTTNSMEMGYHVIQAARAAKSGESIDEVVKVAEETRDRSRFIFVPDTLKYLKKGGRIGGAAALFGTILQIKPILTVENAETTVFDKVRTKKKAIDIIINKVLKDSKEKGIAEIIVHHINCEDEGKALADKISNALNIEVGIQSIGPIIGLHVGPGSIGVAYYTKK